MQRSKPTTNEIYHIYNRGVEKRVVFLDNADHQRFVDNLLEFNSPRPVDMRFPLSRKSDLRDEKLVDIFAFCLMPNHFHLMVRQKVEDGVTEFMRKIGTGYTNYFNKKYQRVGSLFQGKYKIIRVGKEAYFTYLPHYIHLNPLDLSLPEWRDNSVKDPEQARRFLEHYKWSSYPDYMGKKNFPEVTQRGLILNYFESKDHYTRDMFAWITNIGPDEIVEIALE